MTRFLSFLLVVVATVTAFGLGGCSTYTEIRADGTKIEVKQVGVPRATYIAPDYGWDSRYYHRGGDTRGIACTGPFGRTINGVCYETIQQCLAVYTRRVCG